MSSMSRTDQSALFTPVLISLASSSGGNSISRKRNVVTSLLSKRLTHAREDQALNTLERFRRRYTRCCCSRLELSTGDQPRDHFEVPAMVNVLQAYVLSGEEGQNLLINVVGVPSVSKHVGRDGHMLLCPRPGRGLL